MRVNANMKWITVFCCVLCVSIRICSSEEVPRSDWKIKDRAPSKTDLLYFTASNSEAAFPQESDPTLSKAWESGRYAAHYAVDGSSGVDLGMITEWYKHGPEGVPLERLPYFQIQTPNLSVGAGKADGTMLPVFGFPYRVVSFYTPTSIRDSGKMELKLVEAEGSLASPMRNKLTLSSGATLSRFTGDYHAYWFDNVEILSDLEHPVLKFTLHEKIWDSRVGSLIRGELVSEIRCEAGKGFTVPAGYLIDLRDKLVKVRGAEEFKVLHLQIPVPEQSILGWAVLEPQFLETTDRTVLLRKPIVIDSSEPISFFPKISLSRHIPRLPALEFSWAIVWKPLLFVLLCGCGWLVYIRRRPVR